MKDHELLDRWSDWTITSRELIVIVLLEKGFSVEDIAWVMADIKSDGDISMSQVKADAEALGLTTKRAATITIGQPVAVPRTTHTLRGTRSWTEWNATVECSCGWRDRFFAEQARRRAEDHAVNHHDGKATINPNPAV